MEVLAATSRTLTNIAAKQVETVRNVSAVISVTPVQVAPHGADGMALDAGSAKRSDAATIVAVGSTSADPVDEPLRRGDE